MPIPQGKKMIHDFADTGGGKDVEMSNRVKWVGENNQGMRRTAFQ